MSTHSSRNVRTIVLLYFFLTGLITVLVGIVLNQLNLLPPLLSALATSISGFITIIAGSWVLVERFLLPQKPDTTPHPELSGRQVTAVFLMSTATAILLSTFFVELLPPILGNSPGGVVTTFCDAVNRGDSHLAYTQLGSRITVQLSEAKFVSVGLFGAEPRTCLVTDVQESGQATLVKVMATIPDAPSQGVGVFQLGQENGVWKITGESFPTITLVEFCDDIINQRTGAYDYFSPNLKGQVSPDEFRQMWIDPLWNSYDERITSWSVTHANFTMQTQSSFYGRTDHFSGTLVADSNAIWRIQSLQ